MDIMDKLEDIVEKILSDKKFAAKFKKDPVEAIEGLLGVNLPNAEIEKVVKAVKAKVDFDKIAGMIDGDGDGKIDLEDVAGALGKLGGMFGKK